MYITNSNIMDTMNINRVTLMFNMNINHILQYVYHEQQSNAYHEQQSNAYHEQQSCSTNVMNNRRIPLTYATNGNSNIGECHELQSCSTVDDMP
ncbi:hypothetical protein CDAR_610921 [Caerostris darwini]|uniref:Uncharacterized protein n=1 Tax=Caerostris darwini TaxID=1538125 RepID=A0AAV4R4Y1_9ARAC|nr:hypothetical protein CDAR_610921 [Caerostris darwini]